MKLNTSSNIRNFDRGPAGYADSIVKNYPIVQEYGARVTSEFNKIIKEGDDPQEALVNTLIKILPDNMQITVGMLKAFALHLRSVFLNENGFLEILSRQTEDGKLLEIKTQGISKFIKNPNAVLAEM